MFPFADLPFVSIPLGACGTRELQHHLSRGISSDRCKDILQGEINLYAVVFTDYSARVGDGDCSFTGLLFMKKLWTD